MPPTYIANSSASPADDITSPTAAVTSAKRIRLGDGGDSTLFDSPLIAWPTVIVFVLAQIVFAASTYGAVYGGYESLRAVGCRDRSSDPCDVVLWCYGVVCRDSE